LEIKSNWKIEIKLDGSALMRSLECIEYLNINLWSIESTIPSIDFPRFTKFI